MELGAAPGSAPSPHLLLLRLVLVEATVVGCATPIPLRLLELLLLLRRERALP
ncbi:hypothetical protein IscW_ISCW005215 [Ixodes scapularis]|uniref:Uncharacterized protein n=1 Tax=Ixodes scapularis TaxID=6945 RepID=B7PE46_IXOSC|nr:hypothetical protein IscW_ISCW005215 [Ixodes scapularis]|eukprot:XP_002399949.1 hypothetical protein IscW_ISCW005215 [Ixodes scapularis]